MLNLVKERAFGYKGLNIEPRKFHRLCAIRLPQDLRVVFLNLFLSGYSSICPVSIDGGGCYEVGTGTGADPRACNTSVRLHSTFTI